MNIAPFLRETDRLHNLLLKSRTLPRTGPRVAAVKLSLEDYSAVSILEMTVTVTTARDHTEPHFCGSAG